MGFCDHNCVIFKTNRARCALNKKNPLIYSIRKSFMECTAVELVYKFNENLRRVLEKVSQAKVPFKLFWGSHTLCI